MTDKLLPLAELDRLQQLTERYASYTRSAGGLSTLLGSVLCLVMFTLGLTVALDQTARNLLTLLPLLWLLAKELLRRYYYQRAGAVGERISTSQNRQHLGATLFTALICALIIGAGIVKFGIDGLLSLPAPRQAYFLIALLMPIVVWRWLWSSSDYVIGVLLLCQAAVIVAGSHYKADWLGLYIVVMSLIYLYVGWKEHREYLQLRAELQQSRRALQGQFA